MSHQLFLPIQPNENFSISLSGNSALPLHKAELKEISIILVLISYFLSSE